jgi:hypothetical protein
MVVLIVFLLSWGLHMVMSSNLESLRQWIWVAKIGAKMGMWTKPTQNTGMLSEVSFRTYLCRHAFHSFCPLAHSRSLVAC